MERSVLGASPLTKYQFERVGYFCVDFDSTAEKVGPLRSIAMAMNSFNNMLFYLQMVFNRTVNLKEDAGRK